MTAINPAKLKIQAADLAVLINQPDQFTAQLHELCSFYSARVRQTSLTRTSLNLHTYRIPEPVMPTLVHEITESLGDDHQISFELMDALWQENWLEFRQLAILLLSLLPHPEPDSILDKAQSWLDSCNSEEIRQSVMSEGLGGLARQKPRVFLAFIQDLISSASKDNLQAAIYGLASLAKDPSYTNLPLLFKHLSKILLTEERGLAKEISALVRVLASRSEQETTYFLVKQLQPDCNPRILRVIRGVMDGLSKENQALLREKMESYRD